MNKNKQTLMPTPNEFFAEERPGRTERRFLVIGLFLSYIGCLATMWYIWNAPRQAFDTFWLSFAQSRFTLIILPILTLSIFYFSVCQITRDVIGWGVKNLDERQRMVRDQAHRTAYKIEHDGRVFYYGKQDRAQAAQMVIDAAAKISKPGQKLFVGPVNLRKTPYSDAYLYYMLPDLKPGTYYIEMDPGMANANDSGLDKQLASSDIAILSAIWDNWSEPNDSRKVGSDKAEKVLARDFCRVGTYLGLYELYRKCTQ